MSIMTDHYFSDKQESKDKAKLIRVRIVREGRLVELNLHSSSGVFSKDKLDFGTRLLIEKSEVNEGRLLDLGCGYGVIGIVMKKLYPEIDVVCADVNERAVRLAKKNAEAHKLDIEVIKSDSFDELRGMFDTVLLNPPYAAGRDICFRLIQDSSEHLKQRGLLEVVARHSKGGKTLKAHMENVFGNCEEQAKKGGFRIYRSVKQDA